MEVEGGGEIYGEGGTVYSTIDGLGEPLIGASLSEPHTSGTALRICVCMFACLLACLLAYLRPYTVNF